MYDIDTFTYTLALWTCEECRIESPLRATSSITYIRGLEASHLRDLRKLNIIYLSSFISIPCIMVDLCSNRGSDNHVVSSTSSMLRHTIINEPSRTLPRLSIQGFLQLASQMSYSFQSHHGFTSSSYSHSLSFTVAPYGRTLIG